MRVGSLVAVFALTSAIHGCKKPLSSLNTSLEDVQAFCDEPDVRAFTSSPRNEVGTGRFSGQTLERSLGSYLDTARSFGTQLLLERVIATELGSAPGIQTGSLVASLKDRAPTCHREFQSCKGGTVTCRTPWLKDALERTVVDWNTDDSLALDGEESNETCPVPASREMLIMRSDDLSNDVYAMLETSCKQGVTWNPATWLNTYDPYDFGADLAVAAKIFDRADSLERRVGFCVVRDEMATRQKKRDTRDSIMPWVQTATSFGAQMLAGSATLGGSLVTGLGQGADWAVFSAAIGASLQKWRHLEDTRSVQATMALTGAGVSDPSVATCGNEDLSDRKSRVARNIVFDTIGQVAGSVFAMVGGGRVVSSALKKGGLFFTERGLQFVDGRLLSNLPGIPDLLKIFSKAMEWAVERIPGLKNLPTNQYLENIKSAFSRLRGEGDEALLRPAQKAASALARLPGQAAAEFGDEGTFYFSTRLTTLDYNSTLLGPATKGLPSGPAFLSKGVGRLAEAIDPAFSGGHVRPTIVGVTINGKPRNILYAHLEAKPRGEVLLDPYGRESNQHVAVVLPADVDPKMVSREFFERLMSERVNPLHKAALDADDAFTAEKNFTFGGKELWAKVLSRKEHMLPLVADPAATPANALPFVASQVDLTDLLTKKK
jgi:hypothetical protein